MRFKAPAPQPTELEVLESMVDAFAREMKRHLRKAHDDGKRGWSEPEWSDGEICEKIQDHFLRLADPGNNQPIVGCVDLANYVMFLWNRRYPNG